MHFNDFVQLPQSALIFKVFCFFKNRVYVLKKFRIPIFQRVGFKNHIRNFVHTETGSC